MASLLDDVLSYIGAPRNSVTSLALQWWADSEGMPASENNPLATTWAGFGGVDVNSAGVKRYPTITDGALATARTLQLPAYRDVVAALQKGDSLDSIYTAINRSPWCQGCQGGHYPVALWDNLQVKPSSGTSSKPASTSGKKHPRAGKQWDNVQAAWSFMRRTMTSWVNGQRGVFKTVEQKSRRIEKL